MEGFREQTMDLVLAELIGRRKPRPALRTAIRGWLRYMDAAILDWTQHRDLSHEQLRDLLLAAFGATLLAAQQADPKIQLRLGRARGRPGLSPDRRSRPPLQCPATAGIVAATSVASSRPPSIGVGWARRQHGEGDPNYRRGSRDGYSVVERCNAGRGRHRFSRSRLGRAERSRLRRQLQGDIQGTHFEEVSAVNYGAVPATKIITTGTPTKGQCKVKSAIELECVTPFHEHGKVGITVTNAEGASAETAADEIRFRPEVYQQRNCDLDRAG